MMWTINTSRDGTKMSNVEVSFENILNAVRDFRKAWRGTAIGSALGFLSGLRSRCDTRLTIAYGIAKMTARKQDEFGKGSLDGVLLRAQITRLQQAQCYQ